MDCARFERLKAQILATTITWPVCRFLDGSKRNYYDSATAATRSTPALEQLLSTLDGWDAYNEIAIDGMNGTGKSTLASSMKRRRYLKINSLCPRITSGSNYNFDIIKSLEYMMLQQSTSCKNVVWDRCCYSNLIFYYVHQLMYYYRKQPIPEEDEATEVYLLLNNMATATNLLETITFVESIKHVPTVFFVCKNLRYIAYSLQKRNGVNDVYNSKEHNYQIAQYHVYKYFATILKAPLFDISELATMYNITLGDIHQAIRRKLDVKRTSEHDDESSSSIILPDMSASERLNNALKVMDDDIMIYHYSRK